MISHLVSFRYIVMLAWVASGILFGLSAAIATPPSRKVGSVSRWPYEQRIGNYSIHADYDFKARLGLIRQLAKLRQDIAETVKIEIKDDTIHLFLFKRQAIYRKYLRRHFPNIPDRQALFVQQREFGMVFAFENHSMEVDLRHEVTHALLNASLPYVPLWLDEGFAEYFEVSKENRIKKNPHHRMITLNPFVKRRSSIQSLEQIANLSEMRNSHYRDAWSWVHFLLHESRQSRQVLIRFLQDLQAHSPPGSLSRRVAAELPNYRQRYRDHFRPSASLFTFDTPTIKR